MLTDNLIANYWKKEVGITRKDLDWKQQTVAASQR
jgi:hypothetical protein